MQVPTNITIHMSSSCSHQFCAMWEDDEIAYHVWINRGDKMPEDTRTAEDLDNYDRASDFERLGGKVVELPQAEWKLLAEAA